MSPMSALRRKVATIQQLHHRVVEDLTRSIIHGELPTDHVLPPENLLAEQYGVSRTVVREAVRLLVSKGMLNVRQGSGTRVLGPEHWDFLDPAILFEQVRSGAGAEMLDEILESRRIIEGNAAALAARRRTGEDLAVLQHHLGGMEQGLRQPAVFAEQDILFHERILLAARNRLLRGASRPLSAVLRSGRLLTQTVPGGMDHSLQGHRAIYAAIEAQDPEGAQAAMLEHLAQFEHDIKLSLLQQSGG